MNTLCEIGDDEFVPFLHNLGVETYKKSFEWMLHDPEFSGVLRWLHKNLDHNNALTSREDYRYKELQKAGCLLSAEDLESSVKKIEKEHNGICLPGDKKSLGDMKRDIERQKERLLLLNKQEKVMKDLVKQNELSKEQLTVQLATLNAARQQCVDDESTFSQECLGLERVVQELTDDVVDIVGRTLDVYAECLTDKELSKKFLTFGPLDEYSQSQALYRSHFNLYVTKHFDKTRDGYSEEEMQACLVEAKQMEERLVESIIAQWEARAELAGEEAKVALLHDYPEVHPSQIATLSLEAQSSTELAIQEEAVLEQQLRLSARTYAAARTATVARAAGAQAGRRREQLLNSLNHLLSTTKSALALDKLLYWSARSELRSLQQRALFAAQLMQHLCAEGDAVKARIEAMTEIRTEQDNCLKKQENIVQERLSSLLGVPNDDKLIVRSYCDLQQRGLELYGDVINAFAKKEQAVYDFKQTLTPLYAHLIPAQPCAGAVLRHTLRAAVQAADTKVVALGQTFTAVKNGDKRNLRKLWQWFLTDPPRLLAAVKGVRKS